MESNKQCLLEDETEQSLLEELTASDQSSCSDYDDSSGTYNLTTVEVTVSECNDRENEDAQYSTASGAPAALSATFTWDDMTNTTKRKEGQANKRVCSVTKAI
jgi:hypothetical protein